MSGAANVASARERGTMTTYRFEEVKLKALRRWTENGRKRQETKVFMQTLNPFNTNAAGQVKTRQEIQEELLAERKEWLEKS